MIRKKICLVGAFAVGKTSLVARFVKQMFSENYHTTIGVKVDKKVLEVEGQDVTLVIWDLYGEDDFQKLRTSYLKGSAGLLFVADGTRRSSLDTAFALRVRIAETIGEIPCSLLVNKADLEPDWELGPADLEGLRASGHDLHLTSAKTGAGVEEAFQSLARRMLDPDRENG